MGSRGRPHRLASAAEAISTQAATRPFVDQHCHPLLKAWAERPELAWRRCFTEAQQAASLQKDVPASLGYVEFLRAFGRWVAASSGGIAGGGVDPEEGAVAARQARLASDPAGYLRQLFDDAGIGALVVDTGYGGDESLAPADLADVAGRPVATIVRLEPLLERLLRARRVRSAAELVERVREALAAELEGAAVAFKSVAAYRSGLALERPNPAAVRRGLEDRAAQSRRVTDRALIGAAVWAAAKLAAERRVPLQFHVGFGDTDVHLPQADPTLLRGLFRDRRTEACPVVLLHCYPFVAQAAYLASVYPQVHVDLSLTIPLLGGAAARRAIGEALALAPWTKLLAGSDGHSYPEMHWRGARLWREALADVLAGEVTADRMGVPEAGTITAAVLGGNAERLFAIGRGSHPVASSARHGHP